MVMPHLPLYRVVLQLYFLQFGFKSSSSIRLSLKFEIPELPFVRQMAVARPSFMYSIPTLLSCLRASASVHVVLEP